jgi:hypothetical protein
MLYLQDMEAADAQNIRFFRDQNNRVNTVAGVSINKNIAGDKNTAAVVNVQSRILSS